MSKRHDDVMKGKAIPVPDIVNVVATARLSREGLDLAEISERMSNSEYHPARYSALTVRINRPLRATALVFASGKMTLMGCRSDADVRTAADLFAAKLQAAANLPIKVETTVVHNVVGRADAGFQIQLDKLKREHDQFCDFDPESFPGLIYSLTEPDVTLLVFHSGKVVLTKGKSAEDIFNAFRRIYPVLLGHKA